MKIYLYSCVFLAMLSEDFLDPVSMLFLVFLFIFLKNIEVYQLLPVWVPWKGHDALPKVFL